MQWRLLVSHRLTPAQPLEKKYTTLHLNPDENNNNNNKWTCVRVHQNLEKSYQVVVGPSPPA
jgi:hypothetical protein